MRRPAGESSLIGWQLKSSEKHIWVYMGESFSDRRRKGGCLLGLSHRENHEDRELVETRSGRGLASPCKDWLSGTSLVVPWLRISIGNAGDTGSIPSPGRFHMPRSN